MNAQTNANVVYFTFDEANGEMEILPVASAVADNVDTSERSYYGGKWERCTYDEMVAQLSDFIVNAEDEDADDDAEPNANILADALAGIAAFGVIDEVEPGTDVWDLKGDDEDCAFVVSRWDIEKELNGDAND